MTRPKSSRDQWNRIVDFAASADLDDVAEMSEAEVDAELAKAGFDVEEENRLGQAEHDASVRAAPREASPKAKPVPTRPVPTRPVRTSPWLAAPAAALVAAGMVLSLGETVVMVGQGKTDAAPAGSADAGPEGGDSGSTR